MHDNKNKECYIKNHHTKRQKTFHRLEEIVTALATAIKRIEADSTGLPCSLPLPPQDSIVPTPAIDGYVKIYVATRWTHVQASFASS